MLPENLDAFRPTAYRGQSPARKDLIEGRLPRGKVVILAGEGDVGKSWLLLQLFDAINDGGAAEAFGGKVVRHGLPCYILSGEDDWVSTDIRLKTIRKVSNGIPADHGAIIPAPDIGHMALVKRDHMGAIVATEAYSWLDGILAEERGKHGDLGFLAVDTFSTFIPVNANDAAEVQAAISLLASLATKHDICVIVTHHVAKGSEHGTRASIRGSTALVDGSRAAYTLYRDKDDDKLEGFEGEIIKLRCVKNNLGLDRDEIVLLRQADGLLVDISDLVALNKVDPLQALVHVVTDMASRGQRVTKTGKRDGLNALKQPAWPGGLGSLARDKLQELADEALENGLLRAEDGGLVPA